MQLNTLHPAPGSKKQSKRLGRGIGSGKGKTCGRGHRVNALAQVVTTKLALKAVKCLTTTYSKVWFPFTTSALSRRSLFVRLEPR